MKTNKRAWLVESVYMSRTALVVTGTGWGVFASLSYFQVPQGFFSQPNLGLNIERIALAASAPGVAGKQRSSGGVTDEEG